MVSLKVFKCFRHVECLGSTELCNFRAIVKLLSNLLKAIHIQGVATAVTGATIVFLVNGTTKRRDSNAFTVGNFTGEVLKRSLYLFYSICLAFALFWRTLFILTWHAATKKSRIRSVWQISSMTGSQQKKKQRFCCCRCCRCHFYYCRSHCHC